jgi:hypothetical protein
MEYKISKVVYSNREKQVVRKERFAHFPDSQRFWLMKERYSCGNQTDDKKRREIIADKKTKLKTISSRPLDQC